MYESARRRTLPFPKKKEKRKHNFGMKTLSTDGITKNNIVSYHILNFRLAIILTSGLPTVLPVWKRIRWLIRWRLSLFLILLLLLLFVLSYARFVYVWVCLFVRLFAYIIICYLCATVQLEMCAMSTVSDVLATVSTEDIKSRRNLWHRFLNFYSTCFSAYTQGIHFCDERIFAPKNNGAGQKHLIFVENAQAQGGYNKIKAHAQQLRTYTHSYKIYKARQKYM